MSKNPNTKSSINDVNNKLSKEFLFLIACCQTEPSKDDIEFFLSYLNMEHLEYNTIIGLANQHRILPLVYQTLKNLQSDNFSVNSKLLSQLKTYYMKISQQNMLMSSELLRIMKLFAINDIQALAFKGPTLAQQVYGDITMRQYLDVDLQTNG